MTQFKEASFELPTELSTHFDRKKYRPKAVKRWLDNLPQLKRGESVKSLFIFLNEINELDLPNLDRFAILQMIAPPIDDFIESMRGKLSETSFPLSATDNKIAELCSELVSKMVIGYDLVLLYGAEETWLAQKVRMDVWLAALYKMLFYFRAMVCGYKLINRSAPKGLWANIHSLYWRTFKLNWHQVSIGEAVTMMGDSTTLEEAYKELLLMSLMSRHHFQSIEFSEVRHLVRYFAGLVKLRAVAECEHEEKLFCIVPSQDTPPLAMYRRERFAHVGKMDGFVMDGRQLGDVLTRIARAGRSVVLPQGRTLRRETARLLYETWCDPQPRSEPRTALPGTLNISLGFHNTYRMMLAKNKAELKSTTGKPEEEVTYIEYKPDDVIRGVWQRTPKKGRFHVQNAHLVNRSKSGFCLSFTPPRFGSIRHGDVLGVQRDEERILGVKRPGNDSWDLARVCWLKSEDGGHVVLGATVLITNIVAVDLRVTRELGVPSDPIPALLGLDSDGALILVVPHLPAAKEKNYEMSYMGHRVSVDPSKIFLSTPAFNAFRVANEALPRIFRQQQGCADGKVEEKAPAVGTIARNRASGRVGDGEYAAIWDKL